MTCARDGYVTRQKGAYETPTGVSDTAWDLSGVTSAISTISSTKKRKDYFLWVISTPYSATFFLYIFITKYRG